jgi:hypothetical protein
MNLNNRPRSSVGAAAGADEDSCRGAAIRVTIPKNSVKWIRAFLEKAALIIRHYDNEVTCKDGSVSIDEVMKVAERFERVRLDGRGILYITIHHNHSYEAYPSVEVARKAMTTYAFAQLLPEQAATVPAAETGPANVTT